MDFCLFVANAVIIVVGFFPFFFLGLLFVKNAFLFFFPVVELRSTRLPYIFMVAIESRTTFEKCLRHEHIPPQVIILSFYNHHRELGF